MEGAAAATTAAAESLSLPLLLSRSLPPFEPRPLFAAFESPSKDGEGDEEEDEEEEEEEEEEEDEEEDDTDLPRFLLLSDILGR